MANARFFVYIFVLMVIVTCICARARSWDDFDHHQKRLFGCVERGKSCTSIFKSCCEGYKCDSKSGYCVTSSSWLDNRNGK